MPKFAEVTVLLAAPALMPIARSVALEETITGPV